MLLRLARSYPCCRVKLGNFLRNFVHVWSKMNGPVCPSVECPTRVLKAKRRVQVTLASAKIMVIFSYKVIFLKKYILRFYYYFFWGGGSGNSEYCD